MNLDESFNHHCQVVPIGSHGWREEFNTCKRDHSRFIPVPEFKSTFLHPFNETYTDIQKECIELMIDSTVKISVSRTSKKRPATFPRCKVPYPGADLKGGAYIRYGTGYIPFHKIDRIDDKPCPCPACRRSANGNKTHWIVRVSTATHVLFDQFEAESALVELFFDSDAGGKVRQIYGIGVSPDWNETQRLDTDYCVILCVTHEPDLVDILNEILAKKKLITGVKPPTGIMISHPHGGYKMASLGLVNQKCYIPESDSLLKSLVKNGAQFHVWCPGLNGNEEGACSEFPIKDESVMPTMMNTAREDPECKDDDTVALVGEKRRVVERLIRGLRLLLSHLSLLFILGRKFRHYLDGTFLCLPDAKLATIKSKPLINLKRHFCGKLFWGTISSPYALISVDKQLEVTDKEIVFFVPDEIEERVRFECFSSISYYLPACPGSSGARVFSEFCPGECETENLFEHFHHFGVCGIFCISGRVKDGVKSLHEIKDKRIKIII